MSLVPPPIPPGTAGPSTETSLALAKLAATPANTAAKTFATELSRTITVQSKSDSSGPQQNTANSNLRANVFSPASTGLASLSSGTTSAGSEKTSKKPRPARKKPAGISSK